MIRRNPLGVNNPCMHLDAHFQELTEDIPHFFDLIVNDVTGRYRSLHGAFIPSHWHREMEAFHLLSGCALMTVDGKQYEIRPGKAYFINSGALHAFTFTQEPVEYRSFLFDPGIVGGAPGSVFDSLYVRPLQEGGLRALGFDHDVEGDWPFFDAFSRIFQLCRDQPPGYEFAVRDALSQIVLLARHKGQVPPPRQATAEQEGRVKEALRWMEAHLREPITLQDIARQVNLCPRACQKAFRKYLHCTPIEYLQRRRIFFAAQRLSFTDDPITGIALDCGFSSPSYFSKQFKAQTGSTPKEYRAAVQGATRAMRL